ncbi:DUF3784 domain-containing protein [Porphyromonas endodontalis]|uniref:DUF3784 domain-containing protein n=1 Tax=Porphyromonas endodontalis TaxID=28124 RepID=UPI0028E95A5F|nr:DUF3784 domain-containing protein [Porphyromonas endodontalis]
MNTFFILGLIVLTLSPVIYRFPMLLAGYNTISKKERAKIDEKRLKTYAASGLAILGIVTILFGLLPEGAKWVHVSYVCFVLVFLVAFLIATNSNRMQKK